MPACTRMLQNARTPQLVRPTRLYQAFFHKVFHNFC